MRLIFVPCCARRPALNGLASFASRKSLPMGGDEPCLPDTTAMLAANSAYPASTFVRVVAAILNAEALVNWRASHTLTSSCSPWEHQDRRAATFSLTR